MPACHAGGRQFEPDPDRQDNGLQSAGMRSVVYHNEILARIWRHSQVVRQRSAKPLFPGSNPGVASISVQPMKLIAVGIVKWLRQRVVAPLCVGSNPTIHPISVGVSPPSCAGSNPATLANYRDPERNLRALYFQGKSSNCKGCGVSPQTQTSLKKRRTNPAGWRNIGDFGDFAGDEMCGFRLSSYCSYILLNERRKKYEHDL